MSNPYDNASEALQQMRTAATELQAYISTREARIATAVQSNPLAPQAGTPDWVEVVNARLLRGKHDEWGRKLHGVIMGYAREMGSGWKNLGKGRPVGFGEADVTVGTNQPYAKAIQHKHTVSPENSAVNQMIAKAANQLTGESGEMPLGTQRKIIDMMINDPENWWPFDQVDFHGLDPDANIQEGAIPLDALKARGRTQILDQLNKYSVGKSGLDAATRNSLHNHTSQGPLNLQPGLSGPKTTSRQIAGQKAELLTIKIIYGQPRKFLDGANKVTVSKIVFIAYRENGKLTVQYLQHS